MVKRGDDSDDELEEVKSNMKVIKVLALTAFKLLELC